MSDSEAVPRYVCAWITFAWGRLRSAEVEVLEDLERAITFSNFESTIFDC